MSAITERRAPEGGSSRRPNVLLFMTDQQRWDAVGCVGGWVKTPNMDWIAGKGVRFVNAYTNSPVCIPARVSLATGLYPHDLKLWDNQTYLLSPNKRTWMRAVRETGYRTSLFGKTHLHPHRGDLRERRYLLDAYGLDDADEIAGPKASLGCKSNLTDLWKRERVYGDYRRDLTQRYDSKPWLTRPSPLPLELYPDVYVGTQARDYLRSYDRDLPWFCWVSFSGPHEPWDAPEPYASMYRPEDMPEPIMPEPQESRRPRGLLDRRLDEPIPFEDGDVARMRANYAGGVSLIDDQIGEVLKAVEERNELDNTIVALVSDHGEMNGDWGLIYKKNFLDGAVRIPFLLRVPGVTSGAESSALVELIDLGATLIDLVGGHVPKASKARSVRPVLEDPTRSHREVAISEFRHEVMIATTKWKLALNHQGKTYFMIDRERDPMETRNVAGDPRHRKVPRNFARRLRRLAREPGYERAYRKLRRGKGSRPSLVRRAYRKLRRATGRGI